MSTSLDLPARPALRSARFRAERSEQWEELERIVRLFERRGPGALSDDELLELPKLYRASLSALSVARATSLDQGVIRYLESLSARAYYAIYGNPGRVGPRIARFLRRDWPAAVRAIWPEVLVSVLVMLLGAVAAFALVASDPEWFFNFVPEQLAAGRDPSATEAELRETLYDGAGEASGLGVFASYLFAHNSAVSIFAFALGFALGVPTLVLIFYNGAILGAFLSIFFRHDLGVEVGGWLIIHGATELLAIALAGAAGLHIGRATAFPGRRSRMEVAAEHGGRAGLVMAGVIVMLFLAGLIEGYGRQLITSDILRYAIGLSTLALWLAYFFLPRGEASPDDVFDGTRP